jgi:large subunit ribosomal protein L23
MPPPVRPTKSQPCRTRALAALPRRRRGAKAMSNDLHPMQIIQRALITEKGALLSGQHKYIFQVHPDANKDQVKDAVQRAFNVRVVKVNVMTMKGKPMRVKTNRIEHKRDWKKAVVTLVEGDKLELFEGM